MLQKPIDLISRLLSLLMVIALGVMVVLVFTNVVMRYAFNSGITMSEELSRWLFVWMTFMGAFVGLKEHAHLGTDTVVARLPIWGKKLCLGVGHALMLFICWLLFQGALEQTKINWDTTSAVMEVSMGYFYASGLVFSVLGALVLAHELFKLLTGQLRDDELIGVRESDDMPHGNPHN